MTEEMKQCPYCGEEIDASSDKCPHCDESIVLEKKRDEIINSVKSIKFKKPDTFMAVTFSVLLIVLSAFILSYKYKIENIDGQIYRLNQITGNIQLVKGDKSTEVEKVSKADISKLSKLKTFNSKYAKDGIKCNLKYLWRNGSLYYVFNASPYQGTLKNIVESNDYRDYDKSFIISFTDKNGFNVVNVPIKIKYMTKMYGEDGTISYLEIKDVINVSLDDAKVIDDWSVEWRF